jgi:hypothetical protein
VSEPAAGGLLFIPGEEGLATAQKAAQTVYEVPFLNVDGFDRRAATGSTIRYGLNRSASGIAVVHGGIDLFDVTAEDAGRANKKRALACP